MHYWQFKVDSSWGRFQVIKAQKADLCLWPVASFAGSFTSCCGAINVCRSTKKTKCLLGFQHGFVFLPDSICLVCCRFLWLIQVGTICFIHNKHLFYLVYQLVVVERLMRGFGKKSSSALDVYFRVAFVPVFWCGSDLYSVLRGKTLTCVFSLASLCSCRDHVFISTPHQQ